MALPAEPSALVEGAHFSSFKELEDAVRRHEKEAHVIFIRKDSKKIISYPALEERLVYERLVFECKHGKVRKSYSNGVRKCRTIKLGCSARIKACLHHNGDDYVLKVTHVNLTHDTHTPNEADLEAFPEWRKTKVEELASELSDVKSMSATDLINFVQTVKETKLRRKWKSLRDYFQSECNKRSDDAADSTPSPSSKRWHHFRQLMFLKDVVAPKASSQTSSTSIEIGQTWSQLDGSTLDSLTASNSLTEGDAQDYVIESISDSEPEEGADFPQMKLEVNAISDESNQEDLGNRTYSAPPSNGTANKAVSDFSEKSTLRGAKRPKLSNDDQFTELLESEMDHKRKLECQTEPEDDDLLFLKSLLPYIKMIPTHKKLIFRSRVQNVVTEFAFNPTN